MRQFYLIFFTLSLCLFSNLEVSYAAISQIDSVVVNDDIEQDSLVVNDVIKQDSVVVKDIIKQDSLVVNNVIKQDSLVLNNTIKKDSISVVRNDVLLVEARKLRESYEFKKSIVLLREGISNVVDSVALSKLEEELLLCENGDNLSNFVAKPEVIARQKMSLEDFYLYYPLPDKSWKVNQYQSTDSLKINLSSVANPLAGIIYLPSEASSRLLPIVDSLGNSSINISKLAKDSTGCEFWTSPEPIFEDFSIKSNQIFPMYSPSEKTIYFSAKYLYGVGGYDLYQSHWSEEENKWGTPINMGFPYSSPFNDYLFITTADEKYTIFASDRYCSADSVYVYVLVNDPYLTKSKFESPQEIVVLSQLEPVHDAENIDTGSVVENDMPESLDTKKYMEKMSQVRSLRDSIYVIGKELESLREEYALSDDFDKRQDLIRTILEKEAELPRMQNAFNMASSELQKIEMEFLFSGVVIEMEKVVEEVEREVVGVSTNFVFTKKSLLTN